MSQSNEELAEQLKDLLEQNGQQVLSEVAPETQIDGEQELDFLRAMGAFREARRGGNPEEIAAAEERLREVVRGELTGESCG